VNQFTVENTCEHLLNFSTAGLINAEKLIVNFFV